MHTMLVLFSVCHLPLEMGQIRDTEHLVHVSFSSYHLLQAIYYVVRHDDLSIHRLANLVPFLLTQISYRTRYCSL